jgi:spore coat polysaccharide biosynthesis predicted glycosyltransferase SpsG
MAETASSRAARSAAFRLEAGGAAGWGHLARSSALAAELSARGWACRLWTAGGLDGVPPDLKEPFSEVIEAGRDWIARPPEAVRRSDWVVVDDYGVGDDGLARLRNGLAGAAAAGCPGARLLVIDDAAERSLAAADMAVNARPGLGVSPYAGGVRALLGERHALLRPGLRAPEAVAWNPPAGAEAVLVVPGGTDAGSIAATVLEALGRLDEARIAPVLVRSKAGPAADRLRRCMDGFPAGVWLEGASARVLAGWARRCRWAVSAAGGTLHELAFLRLPFVAVVVADNQRVFAREAGRAWGMPSVEAGDGLEAALVPAFRAVRGRSGGAGWSTVDGRGAGRVAGAMEAARGIS